MVYLPKIVDLVEGKLSRNDDITKDVRPSNCCAMAHVAL